MTVSEQWHKTACILCENNCGITVALDGRKFAKIRGDKDHVASEGYTCNKALRLDHYQNGGARLTSPLRREADGTFTEITWEVAIREIAQRLSAIREEHGGKSIFYYGGGGQGNHLGGAYSGALMRLLGARYRSTALAQEKTGEGFVDAHFTGGHTTGEFEHAEVALFIGKNPWQSHGVPRARTVLQQIAKDPLRTMIVLDPVRTETADMADYHVQVRPGTDAWCLTAILGVLVQENLVDQRFIADHTVGADAILNVLCDVDIREYARISGIEEDTVRAVARRIATAASVSTYEDLGVQQGPNSTLISYLNKLIWLLTGNFGKPGAMQPHSWMAPLASYSLTEDATPVTGARILGGMVPCNVIAEEILSEHPDRFRAMIVESSNPAHSLADSQRFREAMRALELSVVIDIALTETGRNADYVLPAASQFEKWEATFFTLEFPRNTFHLRAPLLDPLPGTLPEPEIYARLIREIGGVPSTYVTVLRAAARLGRTAYKVAFAGLIATDKKVMGVAPYLLYETLGPTLPENARSAAVLWALALRIEKMHGDSMRRAGHRNANALFDAILASRSGVAFTLDDHEDAWNYIPHKDKRFPLVIPELVDLLEDLRGTPAQHTTDEFPIVLSVGERRAFTANTIFRDASWRRRDTKGALRLNPGDAATIGLADGADARIVTSRGIAIATVELNDRMQPGHASLPNGLGLDLPTRNGATERVGVAPNELTDLKWRDPIAGTPWHKHVPARIEAIV
ncbi:molybdopterin-dependent oxidoreductase [Hoyosella subflava]|uniref:Molybdopterin oxidoreductase Fe4S4 subunit n=1 Tax=Hoyosella subflava (strain DSM 45089 / JCM 17490 / NBRC 109087 / DQS3-9A1) TaxID=443218 RepID=F6ES07_HOYSD|nr:molybdopterin-dependent oxidoreductase [Hoyosella subflava]AEF40822.1 molybdopterin oxidoreductase Fe4S4 subunit [Hoyosella subflava DQS3-9A1]